MIPKYGSSTLVFNLILIQFSLIEIGKWGVKEVRSTSNSNSILTDSLNGPTTGL